MSAFAPVLRQAIRRAALSSSTPVTAARPALTVAAARRALHHVPPRSDKPGSYSRTDSDIEVEYPPEDELPSSKPVRGIPGQYVKPTLSTFTLDGNVGLVTGGARGLGLVIGQGMVYSGSDLALVDMNSEFLNLLVMEVEFWRARANKRVAEEEAELQCKLLVDAFIRENPNAER